MGGCKCRWNGNFLRNCTRASGNVKYITCIYLYSCLGLTSTVNVQKTKIAIFRHRGKIHNNERWHQLRLRIALHILAFCYV